MKIIQKYDPDDYGHDNFNINELRNFACHSVMVILGQLLFPHSCNYDENCPVSTYENGEVYTF